MKVFVYGTLKKGFSRNYVLLDSRYLGEGRTLPKYTLYDLGAYPAVTDGGETAISGEVYEIDQDTLDELDLIEGVPELYKRKTIKLDIGGKAVIYYLPKSHLPDDVKPIPSGVYKRRSAGPPTALPDLSDVPQRPSEAPGRTLVFSYGSNNPLRLGRRIGRKVAGEAAYLPNHVRVFRGRSVTWKGHGVASVEPSEDHNVYGYVEPLTETELEVLDTHEGVHVGAYRREIKEVLVRQNNGKFASKKAIVYVATSKTKNPPNYPYLVEVAKTISTFWSDGGKPVNISDIVIR